MRRAYLPLSGSLESDRDDRARSDDVEDQRRPALLLSPARYVGGGRDLDDRERLLQGSPARAAHGVRRGGPEPALGQPRRRGRLTGLSTQPSASHTALGEPHSPRRAAPTKRIQRQEKERPYSNVRRQSPSNPRHAGIEP